MVGAQGTGPTGSATPPGMDLAVIIVSWNVRDHLDRCLRSLKQALEAHSTRAEVWVVDNASDDGSADLVRDRHPWVHLHASEQNLGYVRGNNLVLGQVLDFARYVWLLNPDTVVSTIDVQALIGFMDAHPGAGLAGPALLNVDGTLQEPAFRFPGPSQALFSLGLMPNRLYYTALNGRYPVARIEQLVPFRIDHPLGAAMLARSDAVREVGLLDDGFFMYCEEIDWAWRMQKAGWECWLVPAARITHVGGASSQQVPPESMARLWESRSRLYRKHQGAAIRALTRMAVRRTFGRRLRHAADPAWETAYKRVLAAWRN